MWVSMPISLAFPLPHIQIVLYNRFMNYLEETLKIAKNRDTKAAKKVQMLLRDKISLNDNTVINPHFIMGVDLAYDKDMAFVSIVLWDNIKEEIVSVFNDKGKVVFPYIPGFLSFREFPIFYQLYEKLTFEPDVIIFDGHGYAHPRRMGLATHAGILLDIPTIGCAKSKLVGTYDVPENEENAYSELHHKNEIIGYVLRTRKNVKPIFISPGNHISFGQSLKLIISLKRKTKLPVVMQMAHRTCEAYKRSFLAIERRK
ncbi:endonuclease V [candidate division TA06 bacterium]|uniref:Endonuclease V n=1 Tax=candidate division TA06 bacterium TaxID=2250710 RepID=A0A660S7M5_UNCT6|nr:MAG: endonuclease V [candidate division TA06 bacterium]